MTKKILLIGGLGLGMVLVKSFYLTPLLVGIALATAVITSITTIVGFPNANAKNAFLLIIGWIGITAIAAMLPLGPAVGFIAVLAAYYFLIKALYSPPGIRAVFLLALSMVFRTALGIVLVPYLSDIAYLAIF